MLECELLFRKPLYPVWNWSVCDQGISPYLCLNGQSHQHPTFARGSERSAHWLDYRTREGDKCLEVGTDFDRTPGVAYTAVGRCSNESPRSGYHRYVEGQSHIAGSWVAETGLWNARAYLGKVPRSIARMKYLCVYICLRHVIGIGDGVPTRVVNVDKIDFNGWAACCVAVALHVRFAFLCGEV